MMKIVKMKLWGILMACLIVSACSNDDEEITVETTYVPFSVYADYPLKSAGDDTYPQTDWNAGSQLAVMRTDARTYDKILLALTSEAEFEGTIASDTDVDATYSFLYPADAFTANTNDTLTQVLYLNGQNGTFDGVSKFDYTWGCDTVAVESEAYSITAEMVPLTGICKFPFVDENGSSLKRITQVILTSPSGSLYQNATLDMKDGTLSDSTAGSIKVINGEGIDDEIYLALFPGEVPLHFTVTTADGNTYEATIPEDVLIEQGGFHVFDPIVCTSLPQARIGDYYYNDATWSTDLNAAKTCVGIVFALEDESGNISGRSISSAHGRVVALEDCEQEMVWALSSGDIEDIENHETLCDTLTNGSLPYYNGLATSFIEEDAVHQLHGVGIDEETGGMVRWYSSGALSTFDGERYSSFINGNKSKYPAASYCHDYGKGLTGWYLPSLGELALLWMIQEAGIIDKDTHEGYNGFAWFGYWSSTECAENKAWYVNFYSGMIISNSKQSNYNIRSVIRF